jgi:LysR family transcriptional regulator, glycine cleavage system transcriptional activator
MTCLKDKRLVAPFKGAAASQRGYYLAMGKRAAINPDAQDFAAWLREEAKFNPPVAVPHTSLAAQ